MRFASFLFLSALFPVFLVSFLTGYISEKDINIVCKYLFKISSYYRRLLSQILRYMYRKTKFVLRFLYSKILLVYKKVCEILLIRCDEIEERKDNRMRMKNTVENDTKMKMKLDNVVNDDDVANDENNSTYALQEPFRTVDMEESECSLAGLTIDDVRMQQISSCVCVCLFVSVYGWVCMYVCVCVHVCMHVSFIESACVCVCVCFCMFVFF